jgi:hypothetical protein
MVWIGMYLKEVDSQPTSSAKLLNPTINIPDRQDALLYLGNAIFESSARFVEPLGNTTHGQFHCRKSPVTHLVAFDSLTIRQFWDCKQGLGSRKLEHSFWNPFSGFGGTTADESTTEKDAEQVYAKMTRYLGYLAPVLLFGKFYLKEFNVARPIVEHSNPFVKETTRLYFAVAGTIILLQNLKIRGVGWVQGLSGQLGFLLDSLLAVGAGIQVFDNFYF